jgi:hypothetical protein
MYGGLKKENSVRYRRQDLPLGPSDMFFQYHVLLRYRPNWGGGAYILKSVWWRGSADG